MLAWLAHLYNLASPWSQTTAVGTCPALWDVNGGGGYEIRNDDSVAGALLAFIVFVCWRAAAPRFLGVTKCHVAPGVLPITSILPCTGTAAVQQ